MERPNSTTRKNRHIPPHTHTHKLHFCTVLPCCGKVHVITWGQGSQHNFSPDMDLNLSREMRYPPDPATSSPTPERVTPSHTNCTPVGFGTDGPSWMSNLAWREPEAGGEGVCVCVCEWGTMSPPSLPPFSLLHPSLPSHSSTLTEATGLPHHMHHLV